MALQDERGGGAASTTSPPLTPQQLAAEPCSPGTADRSQSRHSLQHNLSSVQLGPSYSEASRGRFPDCQASFRSDHHLPSSRFSNTNARLSPQRSSRHMRSTSSSTLPNSSSLQPQQPQQHAPLPDGLSQQLGAEQAACAAAASPGKPQAGVSLLALLAKKPFTTSKSAASLRASLAGAHSRSAAGLAGAAAGADADPGRSSTALSEQAASACSSMTSRLNSRSRAEPHLAAACSASAAPGNAVGGAQQAPAGVGELLPGRRSLALSQVPMVSPGVTRVGDIYFGRDEVHVTGLPYECLAGGRGASVSVRRSGSLARLAPTSGGVELTFTQHAVEDPAWGAVRPESLYPSALPFEGQGAAAAGYSAAAAVGVSCSSGANVQQPAPHHQLRVDRSSCPVVEHAGSGATARTLARHSKALQAKAPHAASSMPAPVVPVGRTVSDLASSPMMRSRHSTSSQLATPPSRSSATTHHRLPHSHSYSQLQVATGGPASMYVGGGGGSNGGPTASGRLPLGLPSTGHNSSSAAAMPASTAADVSAALMRLHSACLSVQLHPEGRAAQQQRQSMDVLAAGLGYGSAASGEGQRPGSAEGSPWVAGAGAGHRSSRLQLLQPKGAGTASTSTGTALQQQPQQGNEGLGERLGVIVGGVAEEAEYEEEEATCYSPSTHPVLEAPGGSPAPRVAGAAASPYSPFGAAAAAAAAADAGVCSTSAALRQQHHHHHHDDARLAGTPAAGFGDDFIDDDMHAVVTSDEDADDEIVFKYDGFSILGHEDSREYRTPSFAQQQRPRQHHAASSTASASAGGTGTSLER